MSLAELCYDPPMMIDYPRLLQNWHGAAQTYSATAGLHRELANRLLARLDFIKLAPERVLDFGARTGYTTAALQARYKTATVTAMDASEALLTFTVAPKKRLKSLWQRQHKPRSICADGVQLPLKTHSMDLIFSNFYLHWQADLPGIFAEFRRVLRPNGLLMFSLAGVDTLRELTLSCAAAGLSQRVLDFPDMHDIGDALLTAQYADPVMDMQTLTVEYASLPLLFQDLKQLGAQNVRQDRLRGVTTPRQWQTMTSHYQRHFTSDGAFTATVEVSYGHAWVPEPNQSSGLNERGEAVIPIEALFDSN